ncbi:MAG TPA: hypothetical protein VK152_09475 [Paludibacter sp.]|nr:hypothetical protein [Paludibacter sp.]
MKIHLSAGFFGGKTSSRHAGFMVEGVVFSLAPVSGALLAILINYIFENKHVKTVVADG